MTDPARIFPRDPRAFMRDPDPIEAAMAAGCPVIEIPRMGVFMVGGHAAVIEAARSPERFATELRSLDHDTALDGEPDIPRLLRSTGEAHYRVRRMVEDCARLDDLPAWETPFAEAAAALADAVRPGETVDMAPAAERFAYGLLMRMIGLPHDDPAQYPQLMAWFRAIEIRFTQMASRGLMAESAAALPGYYAFLSDLIARRRQAPQDDLISRLAAARWQPDGEDAARPLTEWEIIGVTRQLMAAGANSVRSQLLNCLLLLAESPGLLARLQAEPALLPNFIEESLRLMSSVPGMWRVSACPMQFHGVDIPEGRPVQLRYKAAGLDPELFPDPLALKLDRPRTPGHLAFGYGIHNCLGRDWARAELLSALTALTARIGTMRLGCDRSDLEWLPDFAIRGLRGLPLEFGPLEFRP